MNRANAKDEHVDALKFIAKVDRDY